MFWTSLTVGSDSLGRSQCDIGHYQGAVRELDTSAVRAMADFDRLANESRNQIATNGKDLALLLQTAERATSEADSLVTSLNGMGSRVRSSSIASRPRCKCEFIA